MPEPLVVVRVEDGVAVLELDNPPANCYSYELMRRLGAEVTVRLYPGMGHTDNEEELELVGEMMDRLLADPDP